jgi:antagonist of KipI
MGFRLAGENLNLTEKIELISSAVNFGTIQLLPEGQLIILMADHQTTGGYPRLANVAAIDLPLLAQLNPTDTISFYLISFAEAENLLVQQEIELNYLRTAVRFL